MGRGDACKKPSLVNQAVQKRKQNAIDQENRRLKERLAHLKPYYNTKKWDGEWQEHAHKFGHLRQDGTVGYLLPSPKTPLKRANASRARRLNGVQGRCPNAKEEGTRDEDDCEIEYDEDCPQLRELSPCLLLEATTRQGVEVTVEELQIELTRSGMAELGDSGLMIRGSWKDGILGELLVSHETLVQVAQRVDDLEIMIKLETVSQVPKAGNIPSLSTLLTDDELQKLLVGVVQQLCFQVAPTPPNASSCNSQLLISWCLPMRGPKDVSNFKANSSTSPRERLRPRTCPSTILSDNDCQRQTSEMEGSNYQDDFNEEGMTFRGEADTDPLEIDWAIRFKTAAVLNVDGRRWRTVLRNGSAMYLVSSWFEEETGVQTIKTTGIGQTASAIEVPSVDITYGITAMKELLRQLEGGTLTVPALLEKTVAPLLP
ncbi:hypothetical protein PRNP1_012323 [Phytophthora ramorum]